MHTAYVGTLSDGYICSVPLPRVAARAAHVSTITDRYMYMTSVSLVLTSVQIESHGTLRPMMHHSPEGCGRLQPLASNSQ